MHDTLVGSMDFCAIQRLCYQRGGADGGDLRRGTADARSVATASPQANEASFDIAFACRMRGVSQSDDKSTTNRYNNRFKLFCNTCRKRHALIQLNDCLFPLLTYENFSLLTSLINRCPNITK